MRVLVTGGAGLLGGALLDTRPAACDVHATRRTSPVCADVPGHALELSDAPAVAALFESVRPDVVIHTAYSAAEGERDVVAATRSVVDACAATGADLVYMSTDALLDGERAPYDEAAEPAPVHAYGRWKAEAERYVRAALPGAAVVRTSLILRADPPDGGTAWVVDALRRGEPVRLFVDELRCAIAAEDLARQIWEMVALPGDERGGVWNLAGPEALSRYAIGVLAALRHGMDPAGIVPAWSAESAAPRPRDLRMTTARADRMLKTRPRPASGVLARAADGG